MLMVLFFIMGGSLFFFVESKSFEFSVQEGGSFFLLRIFERSRDSLRLVFLGKESAKRLFSLMENFIYFEYPRHFARTVRDSETVFILQSGSNAHGYYLMVDGKVSWLSWKEEWAMVGEVLFGI